MAKSYFEKLQDPRWQRRRLEVLQAAEFKCQFCESTEKTLHVHHRIYRKGADPWDYADNELIVLCKDCHAIDHEWKTVVDEALVRLEPGVAEQVAGYVEGLLAVWIAEDEIFGNDGDVEKVEKSSRWVMRSREHAEGFADALRLEGKDRGDRLVDMSPLSTSDVWDLRVRGWPPETKEG